MARTEVNSDDLPDSFSQSLNFLKRVAVVGSTGSGKSTFAERLGALLGLPYVELDALHWDPNWTEAPDDVFRERVASAVAQECWITAGNYSVVRDLVWPRATAIVWLDYPFQLVAWRLFLRTMKRGITKEELWNGNRESLHTHFFTKDSLFLWLLKSYWRRKKTLPAALMEPQHRHLKIVRFHSSGAADRWMKSIEVLARHFNV